MIVGARVIAAGEPPYVIAEIGVNHDGLLDKAVALVEAAASAGADAVKVQWFEARRLVGRGASLAAYQARSGERDPYDMLAALELTAREIQVVVDRAHERGMHAIATVFNHDLVAQASMIEFEAFKTASPDIINMPLLKALARTGRPLFVSCGAATRDEVRRVAEWLGDHSYVLMQSVSAYPTPDEHAAIGGLHALATISDKALGYSDHTISVDTSAIAVAAGACVLEKHLTMDKCAVGPDHAASLEPAELSEYIRLARRAHAMLGPREKKVLEIEREVRRVCRQSIVAARDLTAGTVLAAGDLTIKRPGTGLEPWRLDETVGRCLCRAVLADEPIRARDVE